MGQPTTLVLLSGHERNVAVISSTKSPMARFRSMCSTSTTTETLWAFTTLQLNSPTSEADAASTLGNAKKDQFHFLFKGLDQVDFGNKDVDACLLGGMWGFAIDGDATADHTCVAALSK